MVFVDIAFGRRNPKITKLYEIHKQKDKSDHDQLYLIGRNGSRTITPSLSRIKQMMQ